MKKICRKTENQLRYSRVYTVCFFTVSLVGILGGSPVQAQQSENDSGSYVAIEEIMVTAQKRTESLQDVPVSVQVVSADMMVQQNMTTLVTLSETIPSVHVAGSGRSSTYYIRGTGSGESQSFDQSVGTFVDNIYHGRSRNSAAVFLDLDHVEILKGPQSTFFGNSAIAGAFNIVTKKPGNEFEGWARGLASPAGKSGGRYAAEGAINMPLTDQLSLRIAGTLNGQDGYLKSVNTGKRAPNEDNSALRATFLYEPTENLEIILKNESGKSINEGGFIIRQTSCPPPAPFVAAGFCAINLAADAPIGLDTKDFTASDGGEIELRTDESVLTANYQLNDMTLTSTTAYTQYEYDLDFDSDGTALTLLNIQAPEEYRQFSQEFRIASSVDSDLQYMAGMYYQNADLDIEQSANFFFLTGAFSGIPALAPFLPLGQRVNAFQNEKIYSAFGSITWSIDDHWKLITGLRGSVVKKDFDWRLIYGTATQEYGGIVQLPAAEEAIAGTLGLGNIGSINLNRDDEALLPSVKLQYLIGDDIMTYVSYSRGFKAGGFSVADTSADPANYPFDPEYVDAYEVGLKGGWFDSALSLNLAIFRNEFSDLQVSIQGTNSSGGLINIVRNAAESRSQGLEAELQWIVTPYFKVSAAATYMDSEYVKYPNAAPTNAQEFAGASTQDLSGRPTLYSPEFSGNLVATMTVPVFGGYTLTTEASGIFSTDFFTYSTIDPASVQDDYARYDVRLSLDSPDETWGLDIIGTNITDETVINFTGYQPTSDGSLFQGQEPARHIMFQVRYNF